MQEAAPVLRGPSGSKRGSCCGFKREGPAGSKREGPSGLKRAGPSRKRFTMLPYLGNSPLAFYLPPFGL
jgi:hypothetical protein